jgi:hypothetical protein
MKFENIKIGDVVFRELNVRAGFGHGENFWIPRIVQNVTPKQFKVDGKKFRKEDGREIAGGFFSYCRNIGDNTGYGRVVEDESVKYVDYKNMIKKTNYVRGRLEGRFEAGNKNIDEIWAKMIELEKLIEAGISDD